MAKRKSAPKKRKPQPPRAIMRTTKSSLIQFDLRGFSIATSASEERSEPFVETTRDPGMATLAKRLKLFVSYAMAVVKGWFGDDLS